MRTVCALPAGVSWQSQMQEQIGEAPVSCVCSYSHKTPNGESGLNCPLAASKPFVQLFCLLFRPISRQTCSWSGP